MQHIDNELGISYNYTYNEHNQVTEYTEKKGTSTRVKTSCTYDTYYRPTTSTYTVNGKSYSYSCGYANSLGDELSSFTTPLGTVTYTRDDLKRLKSKRYTCKNVSALQSYTYAPNRADGTYTSQLVKNLNFTVGSNVQRLSYTYDASGNITAIEDNAGAVASYEYDGLGRLTRENIAGKKTVEYHYDSAGNLTSKKEYAYTTGALGAIKATHSYQYAGGTWCDRLTFYDGECIVYNSAGYPTTYRGRELTWYRRRAASIGDTTFAYNDSGIRIRKGTTEYFTYGNLILAEKRGDTVIHYYYDDSGVAGFEYNGQKYFYRKNLQGDIIGIYDSCWNLLGQYEYDAWGNLLSQVGSEILNINPFRYRGYYYDAETGLYYLNSRYYDPVIGRFISPDSVSNLSQRVNNGLNLYVYGYNCPTVNSYKGYKSNCWDVKQKNGVNKGASGWLPILPGWLNHISYALNVTASLAGAIEVSIWGLMQNGRAFSDFYYSAYGINRCQLLNELHSPLGRVCQAVSIALIIWDLGLDIYNSFQSGYSFSKGATSFVLTLAIDVGVYVASSQIASSVRGAIAGSKLGAALGSAAGPVGMIVGTVVGVAVGLLISVIGNLIKNWILSFFD